MSKFLKALGYTPKLLQPPEPEYETVPWDAPWESDQYPWSTPDPPKFPQHLTVEQLMKVQRQLERDSWAQRVRDWELELINREQPLKLERLRLPEFRPIEPITIKPKRKQEKKR